MKKYEKPVAENVGTCEGVYMASGSDDEPKPCKFGRYGYNEGADKCQSCSATNGVNGTGKHTDTGKEYNKKDFKGCPENMPKSDEK